MVTSFISYQHLHEPNYDEKVKFLHDTLNSLCDRVFFDKESIFAGDHLPDELRSEIKNADYIIPIITSRYGESDWCVMEYNYAIDIHKRIIPIVLCDDSEIPESISVISYFKFDVTQITDALRDAFLVQKTISPHRPRLPDPKAVEPRIVALRHIIDVANEMKEHVETSNRFDAHAYRIYTYLLRLSDVIRDTAIDSVSKRPILEVHIQHFVYHPERELTKVELKTQADKVIERAEQIICETRIS